MEAADDDEVDGTMEPSFARNNNSQIKNVVIQDQAGSVSGMACGENVHLVITK